MRQPTGDVATVRQPDGSGIEPDRWRLAVTYAHNLQEPGEPALVSERIGDLQLEWSVAGGDRAELWRIVLAGPGALTLPSGAEAVLFELMNARDWYKRPMWWGWLWAFGVVALMAAVLTGESGFHPAAVIFTALLVALALLPLWLDTRHKRIWRERRLLADGDVSGARAAHELVVAYAAARERGDRRAATRVQWKLWQGATPLREPAL